MGLDEVVDCIDMTQQDNGLVVYTARILWTLDSHMPAIKTAASMMKFPLIFEAADNVLLHLRCHWEVQHFVLIIVEDHGRHFSEDVRDHVLQDLESEIGSCSSPWWHSSEVSQPASVWV